MIRRRALASAAVLAALAAAPQVAQGPPGPPGQQPLQPPPAPPGNPITEAKAELGRVLFWDEQLSSTRSIACGTCHVGTAGGSDPRSFDDPTAALHPGPDELFGTLDDIVGSPGVPASRVDGSYERNELFGLAPQATGRKSQPTIGVGYAPEHFWDGRAGGQLIDPLTGAVVLGAGASLESQVLGPPVSDVEMAHAGRDWVDVATRVAGAEPLALSPLVPPQIANWINGRDYPQLFLEAFGTAEVTPSRIAMAIATYERTLVPNQTRFDETLGGNPSLTAQEQQGRQVFLQAGCNACHTGSRLTNDQFFNIGVRPPMEDLGRFTVTGSPADRGRFKTPSLRNVELRAPYFHNGGMATLEDVIDFYDRGGDFNSPTKDPRITPLGLSPAEKLALAAFLRSPLTDQRVVEETGPFARPRLYTESNRAPAAFGFGTPGGNGVVPSVSVVEPGWGENPNLTIAVDGGEPNAPAWLFFDFAPGPGTDVLGFTSFLGLTPAMFALSPIPLEGIAPGEGFGSRVLGLDLGPVAPGTSMFGQWLLLDLNAPGGLFSASDAFELPLF